jgi:hypothetical protein
VWCKHHWNKSFTNKYYGGTEPGFKERTFLMFLDRRGLQKLPDDREEMGVKKHNFRKRNHTSHCNFSLGLTCFQYILGTPCRS